MGFFIQSKYLQMITSKGRGLLRKSVTIDQEQVSFMPTPKQDLSAPLKS